MTGAGNETNSVWSIRPGRDADGPAIVALIWRCWSAYPGLRMDADSEMPEHHALATYYARQGGMIWIAVALGADSRHTDIIGVVAVRPIEHRTWEICRLYADPSMHGSGLGQVILDHAEGHAIAAGAAELVLWTDTRFERAHRFYEKRGYMRHGEIRVLNDASSSREFRYAKPVDGRY